MKPPSALGHAFDATCSAWLDRCVDTVPLRLHRLLSDFPLLRLGTARSLRRLEPIHHRRNKFRRRGMIVHRALYVQANIYSAQNSVVLIERAKFYACTNIAHGPCCGRASFCTYQARPIVLRDLTSPECTRSPRCFHASCCLAVSNARVALPNFYNIAIRITNVAARLAVLGLRLRDELGSSTSPKFITRLNICNADIHKAAD